MSINKLIIFLSSCFFMVLGVSLYPVLKEKLKSAGKGPGLKSGKDTAARANAPVDYDIYFMSRKEKLICILTAGIVIFTAGYIFYRSIVLSLLLTPAALIYPKIRTRELIKKRKDELALQFREALYSIAASLSAGKAVEAALKDAEQELAIQYTDADTYILTELRQINRRIAVNETIEEAMAEFALRSHLEDIMNFTDVFVICKRTGGNLVQVVKNASEIISEKIDVKQEINVLLTEKRLEYKVLNLIPVFIVLMLSTSAEEFMLPVFTEPLGRAAMTIALLLFILAYFISGKIMNIEV